MIYLFWTFVLVVHVVVCVLSYLIFRSAMSKTEWTMGDRIFCLFFSCLGMLSLFVATVAWLTTSDSKFVKQKVKW